MTEKRKRRLCRYCSSPCMRVPGVLVCNEHYREIFGDPNTGSPGTYPNKPEPIR